MLRRLLVLISCSGIFLFSPALHAACGPYYCNGVFVEVLYINNNSQGTVYIYTSGDESAMTDCAALQGRIITLELDTDGGRAIYSTLLAAVTVNRKVDIVARRNGGTCEVSYVRFRPES